MPVRIEGREVSWLSEFAILDRQPTHWYAHLGWLAIGLASSAPVAMQGQTTPLGQARQISHAANYDPSISPDGRRMVYITSVGEREQLFISTIDGHDIHQLTTDAVDHEDPAWSPDGQSIAFVYKTSKVEQIAKMPATGGPPELLTPAGERAIHPNWSPGGGQIAYCTDDDLAPPKKNTSDIKVIDLARHTIRVLITGGINTYPVWSPDGRRLAFRRILGEMNSEVFVADSGGGNQRNLTNNPAFDGWPAWSPDGTRLAFASNRNGPYQIFIMQADGSAIQLVASTTGRATVPHWSPDGRSVYFPICRPVDGGYDCEIFVGPTGPTPAAPSSQ